LPAEPALFDFLLIILFHYLLNIAYYILYSIPNALAKALDPACSPRFARAWVLGLSSC